VVPAPDKNPENIRVEASEPDEMVMKWEVRQRVCQCYSVRNSFSLQAAVSKAAWNLSGCCFNIITFKKK